jgi:hypothetical protein
MKARYTLILVLPFVVLGCRQEPKSVQSQPPTQATVVSDGSNTWFVGGAKINTTGVTTVMGVAKDGTNVVPATGIITGTRRDEEPKP